MRIAVYLLALASMSPANQAGRWEDPAITVCKYAMFQNDKPSNAGFFPTGQQLVTDKLAMITYKFKRESGKPGWMLLGCRFRLNDGAFFLSAGDVSWADCSMPGRDVCVALYPWRGRPVEFATSVIRQMSAIRVYPIPPAETGLSYRQ